MPGPHNRPFAPSRCLVQAIKLDIDHSPTEMAFMHALRDDAELRGLVSEMMFEMHYMHE